MIYHQRVRRSFWSPLALLLVMTLLAACGSNNGSPVPATPTAPPVNGFGIAANHVHSLVALPNHILLLATHYGTFRSPDDGQSWQRVSDGPHQLMQGLMNYSLTVSSLNTQRVYVLTQPALPSATGTLGLYTSADNGNTWQLAIPSATVTSTNIFSAAAGNDTPDEVYIYLLELGPLGLKRSLDDGQHFTSAGTLPFGVISGILAIPNMPGRLLAYGSNGMALSTDGGIHWNVISSITGGVSDVTTPGPHSPIYASGDAGIYVSTNEGQTFTLVNDHASYGSLTVSSANTQVLYGLTGSGIYRSADGGSTWTALPHIKGHLAYLAADPTNPATVYLSLSYPTEVYRFDASSGVWTSLTPKV